MNTSSQNFVPVTARASSGLSVAWPASHSAIAKTYNPLQNGILGVLPTPELNRLLPYLELVKMPFGQVLYESHERLKYVYFPTTSIVSLQYILENGATAQIAMVGNEGMVGVCSFMGGGSTPSSAVVQNAGYGYRLKVAHLNDEINNAGALLHMLLRYTQALITQTEQLAVSYRHHSVEQHVCRFLLLSLDRLATNSIVITHELMASLLGVRRESVTEAAGSLQRVGLIKYNRGQIEVLNRLKLEEKIFECYAIIKSEFDRLLNYIPQVSTGHVDTPLNQSSRAFS